ncbi:MAG: histidine kinase [Candidatus Cloacimonetes bacterium]|nr:histidine kinase [Candidatus Cloacimonadota bacterium]MCF7813647.1 histidine kinase [Candidatus Cloacimonadota bacterium]MCF7868326.1 histidine kinase [Candidatus Cloacimonadota bacterium]MCF7883800.1 histidine kinase [Candidatus Cloacimonadota bacterium]
MEKKDFVNPEVQMYKWWSKLRWFIVLILFAIGILQVSQVNQIYPVLVFVATFLGISVLNILFHMQVLKSSNMIGAIQIVLDIIFATLVVHLTGGISSPFIWIYLIAVITASLSIEQSGGILAAMIGSTCLLILLILYNFDWLTPVNGEPLNIDIPSQTIFLISYCGLFTGIAFISSFISDMLKKISNIMIENEESLLEVKNSLTENQRKIILNRLKEEQYKLVVKESAKLANLDHDINNPLTVISLSIRRVLMAADEFKDQKLEKAGNQMAQSVTKINNLMESIQKLKQLELVKKARENIKKED